MYQNLKTNLLREQTMNKFHAIVPVNADPFLVTWDLGRRCNYDCSYCPSHRHDNFSPHATLQELKCTAEFLFEYISTIAEHRNDKTFHVSFTGGEPTVNPHFIEFAEYIRAKREKYSDQFTVKLDLTTNGAMSEKIADSVIENFDYVTVSYHCEAHDKLKAQALSRISQFYTSGINLKVNVMFHAQFFDECKNVCETLKLQDIKFIPRVIGDDPDSKPNFAHMYTEAQKDWFKEHWGMKEPSKTMRPCCGGRTMGLCTSQGVEESTVVNFREFQGWSCSVNWYFLHIEQQTRLAYTHQTCQARLDGTRGPLGSLDAWSTIVADLRTKLEQKSMPIIVCPNKLCGCGLCTPKSENRQDLLKTLPAIVKDISVFN